MDGPEPPSDLTHEQWQSIRPLLPPSSRVGRPREGWRRQVVNAILYVIRTGRQWRQLPRDFPKWRTVYDLSWHWRLHGVWLGRCRRNSKDDVRTNESTGTMIQITMINLMSQRLARLYTQFPNTL
jgi:transposase